MTARSKTGVLENLTESAVGPYEPFAKATHVANGVAGRLSVAFSLRNVDPAGAEMRLTEALAAWPIMCRVMAELEAAYPSQAEQGVSDAAAILDILDRRDRRGGYA